MHAFLIRSSLAKKAWNSSLPFHGQKSFTSSNVNWIMKRTLSTKKYTEQNKRLKTNNMADNTLKFAPESRHSSPDNIKEVNGDLFSCPKTHSLAHCISADVKMGKGIAVMFKNEFEGVTELLNQGQRPGGLAVLKRGDRFIYYLVTKEKYWEKPTYDTLMSSLRQMRDHNKENGVTNICMPKIGCGLDRLKWHVVLKMIQDIYSDLDIQITIYHYEDDKKGAGKERANPRNFGGHEQAGWRGQFSSHRYWPGNGSGSETRHSSAPHDKGVAKGYLQEKHRSKTNNAASSPVKLNRESYKSRRHGHGGYGSSEVETRDRRGNDGVRKDKREGDDDTRKVDGQSKRQEKGRDNDQRQKLEGGNQETSKTGRHNENYQKRKDDDVGQKKRDGSKERRKECHDDVRKDKREDDDDARKFDGQSIRQEKGRDNDQRQKLEGGNQETSKTGSHNENYQKRKDDDVGQKTRDGSKELRKECHDDVRKDKREDDDDARKFDGQSIRQEKGRDNDQRQKLEGGNQETSKTGSHNENYQKRKDDDVGQKTRDGSKERRKECHDDVRKDKREDDDDARKFDGGYGSSEVETRDRRGNDGVRKDKREGDDDTRKVDGQSKRQEKGRDNDQRQKLEGGNQETSKTGRHNENYQKRKDDDVGQKKRDGSKERRKECHDDVRKDKREDDDDARKFDGQSIRQEKGRDNDQRQKLEGGNQETSKTGSHNENYQKRKDDVVGQKTRDGSKELRKECHNDVRKDKREDDDDARKFDEKQDKHNYSQIYTKEDDLSQDKSETEKEQGKKLNIKGGEHKEDDKTSGTQNQSHLESKNSEHVSLASANESTVQTLPSHEVDCEDDGEHPSGSHDDVKGPKKKKKKKKKKKNKSSK